ncbi:MAG: hypothetical protein ACRCXZ_02580 [Patescibacteria group bacterium]
MIKCDFLIVGDGAIAFDLAEQYSLKNKKVILANPGDDFYKDPDYLTLALNLRKELSNHQALDKTILREKIEQFKKNYRIIRERLTERRGLLVIHGQPELSSKDIAGVHTNSFQEVISFKKVIYAPRARNFFIKSSKNLFPISSIFDELKENSSIFVVTDKVDDIQLAFDLFKIGMKVSLVTNQNVIQNYDLNKIKPKKFRILDVSKVTSIIDSKSTKSSQKLRIYYNYNSKVNHNFYHLTNQSLVNMLLYGDVLGQSFLSYKLNLEKRINKSRIQKFYEDTKYDLKVIVGEKVFLEYLVINRLEEIVEEKKVELNDNKGLFGLDSNGCVIGMRIVIDEKNLGFIQNRLGSDIVIKDILRIFV